MEEKQTLNGHLPVLPLAGSATKKTSLDSKISLPNRP
jgi:hypothetical protein